MWNELSGVGDIKLGMLLLGCFPTLAVTQSDALPLSLSSSQFQAKAAGKIPNIKPSTAPGGIVEYPAGKSL